VSDELNRMTGTGFLIFSNSILPETGGMPRFRVCTVNWNMCTCRVYVHNMRTVYKIFHT
jgi:hypothetical protein